MLGAKASAEGNGPDELQRVATNDRRDRKRRQVTVQIGAIALSWANT